MDNKISSKGINLLNGMTSKIPKEISDLELLKDAEKKNEYKGNIAKEEKNPLVYRAMAALKLSNPFKGY